MAAKAVEIQKFERLDGRPVPLSWEYALHRALSDLYQFLPAQDQKILACFRAYMGEIGPFAITNYSIPKIPSGVYLEHPISTTLLSIRKSVQSEALMRLSAIMVCAALDPANSIGNGPKKLVKFAEKIRGVIGDPNSVLKLRLSEARSIPQLVQIVEKDLARPDYDPKDDFGKLWKSWLRDTITRWMRGSADHLRLGLESGSLLPALDAPALPVLTVNLPDSDDGTEITSYLVEETPAKEEEPSARARYSRAKLGMMTRTSEGDLLANPSQKLPEPLIIRSVAATITAARSALQTKSLSGAEPFIALGLLIATGLREIELSDIVWGDKADESNLVLDQAFPMLYRRVCRPPNAAKADHIPETWLDTTSEYFGFPIPPTLYAMIKELAGLAGPSNGQPVFGILTAAISPPYQLREVIKSLVPEAAIGSGRFRLIMASKLAHQFGPEIPQVIMADTFSLSAAPAYYGSIAKDRVFQFVANIQKVWFGEVCTPKLSSKKYIGSRITLNDEGARKWPESLQKSHNSLARSKHSTDIALLSDQRNRLAAALVSATGHRPTNQIGSIDLDQVIPEYGLIILRDKQSDMLRSTRIAATGKLWLSDLRCYLDRLVNIVNSEPDTPLGKHALAILRSEAPIFSLPDSDGEIKAFNAASLRATMPVELQSNDNFYRHRLNQYLQKIGLDPELRHFQMGWVVSPANALADLSPLAAADLGRLIGPSIDEMLIKDGWYAPSKRITAWNWQGIPLRVDKDWDSVVRDHEQDHKKNIQTLIEKLREERKAIAEKVMPRMVAAFAIHFPKLMISQDKFELVPAPGYENQRNHEMLSEHYGLICDQVRQNDSNPADSSEAVVARDLLYRLIKKARNAGLVVGPLPSRIFFSPKDQPSPFPPGLGLAVRQAEAFKALVIQRAGLKGANESSVLALLSVLAFSPYRNFQAAKAAVQGAKRIVIGQNSNGILRLPAKFEKQEVQMVFGGIAAVLLGKLTASQKTLNPPSEERISSWLAKHCKRLFDENTPLRSHSAQLESILRMAGRLELSGSERLAMLEHDVLSTVPTYRSLADDDNWPVQTSIQELASENDNLIETYDKSDSKLNVVEPEHIRTHSGYRRLTYLLNPVTRSPNDKNLSDGHRGWREKLNKDLERYIIEFGERSNLGVLAGFVRRRLLDGGDHRKKLSHSTLYKELTYFGSALLGLMGKKSLLNLNGSGFQEVYLALLHGKPVASRAHVYENLRLFHKYLMRIHDVAAVSFDTIAEFAGPRVNRSDMGLLTIAETRAALKQLHNDLNEEVLRAETSPSILRLCNLRIVMFYILEASGMRPGSVHGLTLGDIHLIDYGQDFIHIHKTGEYGQAKSQASVGFFPLVGELWEEGREWVIRYIENEKSLLSGLKWWTIPLFAESLGSRIRFSQSYLTQRFDQLVKWASNEKNARTYWLRKNRITSKHRIAISRNRPMARDVYNAISSSGQAGITVALTNYISDPKVVMSHNLRDSNSVSRETMLQVSSMPAAVLDMAWARNRGKGYEDKAQPILSRMDLKVSSKPEERLTPPPPLKRPKQLLPIHIDSYARAQQHFGVRSEAILRSGISDVQADLLDIAARKLLTFRGLTPWKLPEMKIHKAVLKSARELHGTKSFFKLLETMPSDDLVLLSEAWVRQSHIHKRFSADVILILDNQALQNSAIRLLEQFSSLKLSIDSEEGEVVLKRSVTTSRELGHSSAFEWVLVIIWIFKNSMHS